MRQAIAALALLLAFAPSAIAAPGPDLRVSVSETRSALTCLSPAPGPERRTVLLTPAFSSDRESYGWNYLTALPALGHRTCSLSLDDHGFGDLQLASEYVVRAVRWITRREQRTVALLGHQHGALDELWAMRYWPDLRKRVSDLVSLATPYNGTESSATACALLGRCSPSSWQIARGSKFLGALGSDRPPRGPSYTSISTDFDELIIPQPDASRLEGAANVAVQDLCPGRPVEHFTILGDAVAYALAVDAFHHRGPARPDRIPRSVCGEAFMPGAGDGAGDGAGFLIRFPIASVTQAVPQEPALRPYAR